MLVLGAISTSLCFVVSSLNFSTDLLGVWFSVYKTHGLGKVMWVFEDVYKFSCWKLSSLYCPHGCLLNFLIVIKQKMQDMIGKLTYLEIWVTHW